MRDPYALIRELIFLYKGKPKEEVIKAVINAFKEAYGIYLPDLGVPYEELAHFIQEGKEDEAYDWLEAYLYDYLIRQYEEELRSEEEQARVIGECILEALRKRRIKVITPEKAEEQLLKILEEYPKLLDKVKELQKELSRLKKKEAEVNLRYTKGKATLEEYLRIAQEVEKRVKPLEEELERLRKERDELLRRLKELEKLVPQAKELEKEIKEDKYVEKLEEETKELEQEVRREYYTLPEKELRKLVVTTRTETLQKWLENPRKYLQKYVELLGVEKVRNIIRKELEERGALPSLSKIIERETAELRAEVSKVSKKLPREFYIRRKMAEAWMEVPEYYKPIIELCAILGVKHPRVEDYYDLENIKYELRAAAIYLYRTNPTKYEQVKDMFVELLPKDLFDFIFPY